MKNSKESPKQLIDEFKLAIQLLLSALVEAMLQIYRVVEEMLQDRSSVLDWMLNFFGLQPIAFIIYGLPMSILTTLMGIAAQLLFASAAVLAQAQIIFDHMMQQILDDVANAAQYVWDAITALMLLPGIGRK